MRDWRQAASASAKVGGSGISAQYVQVPPGIAYDFQWQGKSHFLAFHDLRMKDGETCADDVPVKRIRDARGTFTFLPSGCHVRGWTVPTTDKNSFLALYIDPDALRDDLGPRMAAAALQPEVFFSAPSMLGTIGRLRRALASEETVDPLLVETLCVLTTIDFCRHRQHRAAASAKSAHVGRVAIARIDEFIDAHIGAPITLDELAQLAGLSRFHFVRAFHRDTGETPYQRVLRMRMERALCLLAEQRLTVSEIARLVGFSSASRFIAAFRRAHGATPGEFALPGRPELARHRRPPPVSVAK